MLTAIIVAAGRSRRAGFDKIFIPLAGRPLIQYSLEAFARAPSVKEIVIVCREDALPALEALKNDHPKLKTVIAGGVRRQDSVGAGLAVLSAETTMVAVHDAARPLITPGEIERVHRAAEKNGAAVLARPVTDTLKLVNARQEIVGSIERADAFAMQTPQIFSRQLLTDALARIVADGLTMTDEVSAVQHVGGQVSVVPAEEENAKITFAHDLVLAELIIKARREGEPSDRPKTG
ncbi:MAG: 2-C-methyl-D-erythritol 4-phosphate cytidylyltransferase [Verrucomicrobiota bacterium]